MMKIPSLLLRMSACAAIAVFGFTLVSAQAKKTARSQAIKPIIFAVLNEGRTLEPIAHIAKGKLEPTVGGDSEPQALTAFVRTYLKKGEAYQVVFGGAAGGTATVKSSNAASDCAKNQGTSTLTGAKTPLRGFVMALATNAGVSTKTPVRRKPTAAEKEEIDTLVRAEYAKQKLTPKALRYHNLTALDLERDGKAELVGSYWVEIDRLTRGLLFFIAGKGANGKYSIGFSDYNKIDQGQVMSGEIKSVDDGVVYSELLLDVFDHDGDGTSEVFTYIPSFEGAGFNVYRRSGNKWTREFEGSNYHCGY